MPDSSLIIKILKDEVRPAIGCTEPVAIALACAYAAQLLGEKPERLSVVTSRAIYKNGMDVGIPGTSRRGLNVAAALGAALADPSKGLELLGSIDKKTREAAEKLLETIDIEIGIDGGDEPIYIEATLEGKDYKARALIIGRHDNLVELSLDGEPIKSHGGGPKDLKASGELNDFYQSKIIDVVETVEAMDAEDLFFLLEGLDMNLRAAELGASQSHGLGVGHSIQKNMDEGLVAKDFTNLAYMLTAAASDVRMSGERVSVMSSSGSGNNGLTAILPLAALREIRPLDDKTLAKALAISHLLTSYVKHYIGRLSNLCGCSIAAAIGSGSAIAWILEGKEIIPGTINNIIANQAGVICDGAKPGCALKIGTAAMTAVQSALLAKSGTSLKDHNGICDPQVEKSIANLARLSSPGMNEVDETVIGIMRERE